MNKTLISLAAAVLIAIGAGAQSLPEAETAFKVKREALSNSQIDRLATFMTDYLGPRLAASKQKLRAEQEVADTLRAMGLANVHAEKAMDFAKGGWDNKRNYVAMTAPYYTSFAANPKAWSGSTPGLTSGECILLEATDAKSFEPYRGKLKGKIVVMPATREYELSFDPQAVRYTEQELADMMKDERPRRPWRRRAPMDPGQRLFRQQLDSLLRAEGAIAVMVGDGQFNIPGSRGVSYTSGDPEPLPEVALPIEDHGRMVRLLQGGKTVAMELDILNEFTPNCQINNIIAEIPGTDPKLKDEIVLIGAHLDSWHGGTGGADNAAGCITMIEAMRILNDLGLKPRRTIRLALWGGEEQGLYGSRGYAAEKLYDRQAKKKLPGYDRFALYLNNDFGSGRYHGIYLEQNDMARPFFETWGKPLESLGFTTLSPNSMGSTDHVTFNMIGLPAYQFVQDPLDYFRAYHTTMDTYERINREDMRVNAAIVAWLAYCAAMDSERIPVKPGVID
ncbi:MAG: M20/M25/M40 family metallo-hydrolase [Pseudoflavonifractor sp.]|nr:M20/M25/M40 family metallo-hydrolase [Alloprevotella sp.]MCM1116026.1 M20/M25/M40 family metallo-hydrolase [Pseudoflavonifractor sp.]